MTRNWKAGLTSAIFSLSVLGAGAAVTTAAHAQTTAPVPNPVHTGFMRGEGHSLHNIHWVRRRLEKLIDELQHDQHDYGGQRVQALQLMQQARQHLLEAEQFDRAHPGQ